MQHIKNFDEFLKDLKIGDEDTISIKDIRKNAEEKNLLYTPFKHPLDNDNWIYRITIIALGLIVLGVLLLSYFSVNNCQQKCEVSSGVIAIGGTAVGALASLISLSNRK